MPAAHRGRYYWIVAASLAAHVLILTGLALYVPRWKLPPFQSGPPEAIIPVLIMPRVPPPSAAPGAEPQPIHLHRRPQRFAPPPPSVKPLLAPEEPNAKGPATPGPKVLPAPSPADTLATNARNALRSKLGCADADALGLSKAEREACENQLAKGAKQADFPGLGLDADKADALNAAALQKDQANRFKRNAPPVGVPTPPGTHWDEVRSPPGGASNMPGGASAEQIGRGAGTDKPTYSRPF